MRCISSSRRRPRCSSIACVGEEEEEEAEEGGGNGKSTRLRSDCSGTHLLAAHAHFVVVPEGGEEALVGEKVAAQRELLLLRAALP